VSARAVTEWLEKFGQALAASDATTLAALFRPDAPVRKLFGDGVADRVGPIWGFDETQQELRNMWTPTGRPGLWFIAGSFAQCRIYLKTLALQIKAAEEGLKGAQ
jgi:putative flavoprotein involved in K+ transport